MTKSRESGENEITRQAMKWFAAHIIMVVKLKNGPQKRFPVWENIVLVSAESDDEAFAKTEQYGRKEEGDDDCTFRWDGKPARWVFAGVRKLTECAVVGERPDDGTEISYNEMELGSERAIEQFVAGRPTSVRTNDRFLRSVMPTVTERAKNLSRKPA